MKRLTILFAAFIVAVIVLADTGHLPSFLRAYERIPYGDKIGHFVLIGILSFLAVSTTDLFANCAGITVFSFLAYKSK